MKKGISLYAQVFVQLFDLFLSLKFSRDELNENMKKIGFFFENFLNYCPDLFINGVSSPRKSINSVFLPCDFEEAFREEN